MVHHVRVLKNVKHQDRRQADGVVPLVLADPPVEEAAGERVVIEDDPADATHRGRRDEVPLPLVEAPPGARQRPEERSLPARLDARPEIAEVVLVEHHAVELEAGAPLQLGPGPRARLDPRQLLQEAVDVLHVALVEGPVLLDLVVGDALETVRFELLLDEITHPALLTALSVAERFHPQTVAAGDERPVRRG